MAIAAFITKTLILENRVGNALEGTGVVLFPNKVLKADGALQGFTVSYKEDSDHDVKIVGAGVVECDVNSSPDEREVTFSARLELGDRSNNYIDTGAITVLISAVLEDVSACETCNTTPA